MTINVGDKAPNFLLKSQQGKSFSLESFSRKWLVVYFYPKDATPGCTLEANNFQARYGDFKALDAEIVGVSKDSLTSHTKFAEKQGLTFPLLSDDMGEMCEAYGVWVEKSMYGRTYMGIDRATFLVDPDGVIQQIWRKVKVKGHVEKVLDAVKGLQ